MTFLEKCGNMIEVVDNFLLSVGFSVKIMNIKSYLTKLAFYDISIDKIGFLL